MALTDLTRISTSGIATGSTIDAPILRKDVSFHGSQVGVVSALFDSSDNALEFNDNVKLKFGNSGDLELYHNGADNYIDATTGSLYFRNTLPTNTIFQTGNFLIKNQSDNQTVAQFAPGANGGGKLYHENALKFQTTQTGAVVTGILTATSFSGPTYNTSGIATFYDLRVSNNLTVEGTTTTLDTNLIGVDRVEVGADSNTIVGVAVTQSGTADIVNLFDGTTEVLTVKDGGFVGVGTINPGRQLHVLGTTRPLEVGSTNLSNIIKLYNSGTGRATYNGFDIKTSSTSGGGLVFYGGYLDFATSESNGTDGTSRIRILSNGKVGIGTAVPDGTLTIHGASGGNPGLLLRRDTGGGDIASISWRSNTASFAMINYRDAAPHGLQFYSGGTASSNLSMIIRLNGNVGIGTEIPQTKLEVVDSSYHQAYMKGSSTVGGIRFGNNTYTNGYIYYDNGPNMNFQVGGIERFRINNAGDIQIGTAATTGTLRYVDIQNSAVGNGAGTILRLITSQSDESGTVSADIVKYKTGGLYINNNETLGTTGFISFGTGTAGGSVSPRLRISSGGDITFGVQSGGGAPNSSTQIRHFDFGRDHWNSTAGDYRALRLKVYNVSSDDVYGFGISSGMLEVQSQQDIGFYAGTSGSGTGRRELRITLDSSGNSLSLESNTKLYLKGTVNNPTNHARINIGRDSSGETRAIDIWGSWAAAENKSITFNHGTSTSNIVAQINAIHNGPGSSLRWGKLYHSGDSSTYTMTLDSTSATGADLSLTDGNLKVAAGHGIDFSATANSSGSGHNELLDDYESGAWTPTITGSTSSPTFTYASGFPRGRYIKVGNQVTVWYDIAWSGISGGSGTMKMTNLPFATGSWGYHGYGIMVHTVGTNAGGATTGKHTHYANASSDFFYTLTAASTNGHTQISALNSSGHIFGGFTYGTLNT